MPTCSTPRNGPSPALGACCSAGSPASHWAELEPAAAGPTAAILSDPPEAPSCTAAPLEDAQGPLLSQLFPAGSQGLTECWESTFPGASPFHFGELAHPTCPSRHGSLGPGYLLWVLPDSSAHEELSKAQLLPNPVFLPPTDAFNFPMINTFRLHTWSYGWLFQDTGTDLHKCLQIIKTLNDLG